MRWYGGRHDDKPQAKVQHDWKSRREDTLPEKVVQLAHAEYARRHSTPYEVIQQRGGFSRDEIIMLLADSVERLMG